MSVMRDDTWLQTRFAAIHHRHFQDIELVTPVEVQFGRPSYRRLGSIALRPKIIQGQRQHYSRITISAILKDPAVPTLVIDQVLAHELVHYVHGFGSERPRKLKHPHQGGVIVNEYKVRGLWELFRSYQAWMKLHWAELVAKHTK